MGLIQAPLQHNMRPQLYQQGMPVQMVNMNAHAPNQPFQQIKWRWIEIEEPKFDLKHELENFQSREIINQCRSKLIFLLLKVSKVNLLRFISNNNISSIYINAWLRALKQGLGTTRISKELFIFDTVKAASS